MANSSPSKSPIRRVSSNLMEFTIEEDEEKNFSLGVPLNDDEKASISSASLPPSPAKFDVGDSASSTTGATGTTECVLWEGVIFENVQSLRHFKDSKDFVDLVVKICDLTVMKQEFQQQVIEYKPFEAKMTMSVSHGGHLHSLANFKTMSLISHDDEQTNKSALNTNKKPPNGMARMASFPKAAHLSGVKYHSIMDKFIKSHFFNPGFELLAGEMPEDWRDDPQSDLFTKILCPATDEDVNTEFLLYFAKDLNRLWRILYRVVNKNVSKQPFRYSLIPLKHPGIFVPGGRFREIYYWDSHWIVQGLICCGMLTSAKHLTENLADLADRYGFIPNGTRKYYLTRSQPPLLITMAHEVYKATKDKEWLKEILPSLTKEHVYWTTAPMEVPIVRQSELDVEYRLARYYSKDDTPRPESYYEDRMTTFLADTDDTKQEIYQNIRAAAASGWDFSSRWYFDKNGAFDSEDRSMCHDSSDHYINPLEQDLGTPLPPFLPTMSPMLHGQDLSSHMMKFSPFVTPMSDLAANTDQLDQFDHFDPFPTTQPVEDIISSDFDKALSVDENIFNEFAEERIQFKHEFTMAKLDTIHVVPVDLNVFLCKAEGFLSHFYAEIGDEAMSAKYKQLQTRRIEHMLQVLWDENNKQFRDWNFRYKCYGNLNMISNFSPLWLQCDHKKFKEKQALLVDSLVSSQLVCGGGIVTTLFETEEQWDYPNCWAPTNMMVIEGLYCMGEHEYALKLANIWINNNYHTYLATKKMHEKYHCERYGTGGGGEYKPQFGFGWTNGSCLRLMEMFGSQLIINQPTQTTQSSENVQTPAVNSDPQ